MTAIGMALTFGAYALGLYGYCLMKSYDVTPGDLWLNTWPGAKAPAKKTAVKPLPGMSGTTANAEG